MILIHDWRPAPMPTLYPNPKPRVARRCQRCGAAMTVPENEANRICPPLEEAKKMFREPVLCEPD